MSARYLTLKKNDTEFLDYLWGRASILKTNHERAIPVKTYNLGTNEESVTFELQKISDIKKPGNFLFLSSLIKLNSFILILFPLFYILVKNYMAGAIKDPLSLTLASVSSLLLFAGLNIRNDIFDHISGFDRVNLDPVKKPIRQGWISAMAASRLSVLLIAVSGVLAIPVILLYPDLIKLVLGALILFFVGRFAKNNSYKHQHLGELILFVLIGPLLSIGYQLSAGARPDAEVFSFGTLWGLMVIYLVHVNNFSHIMTSSLSGIRNTMTKLGFDHSQKFLIWGWVLIIGLSFLFHVFFSDIYWTFGGTFLLVLGSIPLYLKISDIKSPMGSGLQQIRQQTQKTFLIMLAIFLSEKFWNLWTASL